MPEKKMKKKKEIVKEIMSRSKVSILSKYVTAIAILALLFSVSITTARYVTSESNNISAKVEQFDIDVKLYDIDGNELSELGDVYVDDLASYTNTYYMYIYNHDNETLYYDIEINDEYFAFTDVEVTVGELSADSDIYITLEVKVSKSGKESLLTMETKSLPISISIEYQHGVPYPEKQNEEEEEPYEDENHSSEDWYYLNNDNVSGATLDTDGQYCLIEDVTLTDKMSISANVTLCLNGHSLTNSTTYTSGSLIQVTGNGSLTIQDCQDGGYISSSSTNETSAIYVYGSSASVTMTSGEIKDSYYALQVDNNGSFTLEGGTITNSTVNVTNGTFNMNGGSIEANGQIGINATNSSTINLTSGTINNPSNGIILNGSASLNMSGGTITNCQGNGININSGTSASISGGNISSSASSGYGVNLSSGASLNLSGAPTIANSTSGHNLYLASGAYITLGNLASGANIGVTSASGTGQISYEETSTHYYESAINYIHSDSSSYKVSGRNSGYLSLISSSEINFTVALQSTTSATSPSLTINNDYDGTIKIDGGEGGTFQGDTWMGEGADWTIQRSMSTYSGGSYSYNYYFSFGGISTTEDFCFALSPCRWWSNLCTSGIATSSFWPKYTASNYYIWPNQYDSTWSTNACWGFTFSQQDDETSGYASITSTLQAISDFTIVLQLDYANLTINWDNNKTSTNNVVTGAYLLLDGATSSNWVY